MPTLITGFIVLAVGFWLTACANGHEYIELAGGIFGLIGIVVGIVGLVNIAIFGA